MLAQVQFYVSLVVLLPAALPLPVAVDYNQCPYLVAAPGVGWYCCGGYTVSVEHGEVVGYRPYVSDRCLDIAGKITYTTTSAPTGWVGSKVQAYLVGGCAGGLLFVALVSVLVGRRWANVHAPVPAVRTMPLGDLEVSEPNVYAEPESEHATSVSLEPDMYQPLTVYFSDTSPTRSLSFVESTYGFTTRF